MLMGIIIPIIASGQISQFNQQIPEKEKSPNSLTKVSINFPVVDGELSFKFVVL